jgi:hypothetical protein
MNDPKELAIASPVLGGRIGSSVSANVRVQADHIKRHAHLSAFGAFRDAKTDQRRHVRLYSPKVTTDSAGEGAQAAGADFQHLLNEHPSLRSKNGPQFRIGFESESAN